MYLPQYHRTPENDEWWGEGFTDWEAVKKAKPLFEGHNQPRVPLNDNYYDLLEKNTMQWQADLMHEYGIDGMCIYHYWFKDGRQVLEKPAENLLRWTDIDMPFCFCWANETWARSWSNIKTKNPWADNFEKEGGPEILLEQQYGAANQWRDHFDYLLSFFKDDRYIKIDGKPVFIIYAPWKIHCLLPMIDLWRRLAIENGLKGLYLIGAYITDPVERGLDAGLSHEPVRAKDHIDNILGYEKGVYTYDEIWDDIEKYAVEEKNYYGVFTDYDDSPRRGDKGYRIEGFSVEKFQMHLTNLINKNITVGNELIFINAWNEWGEGMYLEPDLRYGERVLEVVKKAKEAYNNSESNNIQSRVEHEPEITNKEAEKAWLYVDLLDQWMQLKEKNKTVCRWLEKYDLTNVAIYGYGILGRHLLKELSGSSISVSFVIDKMGEDINCPIQVYSPHEGFPSIETIIVTPEYYFDEIYIDLRNYTDAIIIPLQQLIEECMYDG